MCTAVPGHTELLSIPMAAPSNWRDMEFGMYIFGGGFATHRISQIQSDKLLAIPVSWRKDCFSLSSRKMWQQASLFAPLHLKSQFQFKCVASGFDKNRK